LVPSRELGLQIGLEKMGTDYKVMCVLR
jgi:hypothetical protein